MSMKRLISRLEESELGKKHASDDPKERAKFIVKKAQEGYNGYADAIEDIIRQVRMGVIVFSDKDMKLFEEAHGHYEAFQKSFSPLIEGLNGLVTGGRSKIGGSELKFKG